jgi:hypothetical protein
MIIEVDEITALFDEFYLIDEKPIETAKVNENILKIHFEGGNGKGLVFVFATSLSEQDQDMIQKLIHNALKIKMEDIALVHLRNQAGIGLQQVIDIIKPQRLILWGNHPSFPNTSLYELGGIGGISFVQVDDVSKFHDNISLKTSLWNSIQQLTNG